MWSFEYQKEFKDVSAESIWEAWTDVNNWPKWDSELERTTFQGNFQLGSEFQLKPKGGPNIKIEITEIDPLRTFTSATRFPLAWVYDYHEVVQTPIGVLLKSRISVTGPLGWLWRKLIAQGLAAGTPSQIESLVNYAKKQKN